MLIRRKEVFEDSDFRDCVVELRQIWNENEVRKKEPVYVNSGDHIINKNEIVDPTLDPTREERKYRFKKKEHARIV